MGYITLHSVCICVHITLLWSYQFSISKEGKYLLARWYWGLHVCSIKKQVSVFDDDTFFGLPKAHPTYCQCAKLFKNGTFWQHTTTGTRLGIFNLGGLNQGPLISDGRNSCKWTYHCVGLSKFFIMIKILVKIFKKYFQMDNLISR